MATKGKETLMALFDSQASGGDNVEIIKEQQAIHYLKTGNEKAFELNILPIKYMEKKTFFKQRFDDHSIYDPVLIKSELAILFAKDGGNYWLVGERLFYIRKHKIFKNSYGYDSFEEFIRDATPYSKSTAYNYIKAYEHFSYEDSIKAGSKLALMIQSLDLKSEQEQARIFNVVSDKNVTFREAKSIIKEATSEPANLMSKEEIQEDVFNESKSYTKPKDIPTRKTDADVYEKIALKLDIPSIVRLKMDSLSLENSSDKQFIKDKKYRLMIAFENEAIMKLFNDALQNTFNSVKRNMEHQLSQPENHSLVKKLEKAGLISKDDDV